MKWIIVGAVLGLLLTGGLYLNRQGEIDRLRGEVAKVQSAKSTLQQAAIETAQMEKAYTKVVDVAAFTEALYGCARQAGIRDHDVITQIYRAEQLSHGNRGRGKGGDLQIHRLQVSMAGGFRDVADYLGRVQKLDSPKRMTRLALVPGEKQLEATVIIDLYTLGAPHVR